MTKQNNRPLVHQTYENNPKFATDTAWPCTAKETSRIDTSLKPLIPAYVDVFSVRNSMKHTNNIVIEK